MRLIVTCGVLGVVLAIAAGAGRAGAATPAERAAALEARAQELLARNTIDTRREALRALEQATLLVPDSPQYQLELARAYFQAGFLKSARVRYERVTRIAPEEAEGRFGLGLVWRRDWLKYLDGSSLERAVDNLSWAARLRPEYCDAWLTLVPLLVERGDDRAALSAAQRARAADPARPEAVLAEAYTSFRLGTVERADSLFRAALPRLRPNVRERFEDIAPVASAADTATLRRLPPDEQAEFVRRFWIANDPDPVTPENEAQLEYWSRVAQAYFLFYDPRRREWDERGEVYVRYGPPAWMGYNPVGSKVAVSLGGWLLQSRANVVQFGTGPEYPANVQLWAYPGLGMEVLLQDRTLNEHYLLPITSDYDPDPLPNPDSLARLPGATATASGRAVFHTLPPGVRPMPIEAVVARFEGDRQPRLIAQVEAPGTPADSLWADWVVIDSTRREVARGGRTLSPSACDATAYRVADFAAELPPGEYMVGLSVRDGRGRRGVYRAASVLAAPPASLSLSDVVLSCGAPDVSAAGASPVVRLEPNPAALVQGDHPLTAYFEIYHLAPGPGGAGRFEYVYTVRSASVDRRPWIQRLLAPRPQIPEVSVTRAEENVGPLRRQFVSVPIQSLPPGLYRLEVRVRDLTSRAESARSALFLKAAPDSVAD